MLSNRKKLIAFIAIVIGATGAFALSNAGRAALNRVFSPKALPAAAQTAQDLEQRVRARHGWNGILNSVITGQITYYDREGQSRGQASFTFYRVYPDRMRVVIDRAGSVDTIGFDQERAWKQGSRSLTDGQARDIRAWLRLWPERLFSSRARGAAYREAGRRVEDSRATPWRAASPFERAVLEQVEIQDMVGAAGDRRSVYYYIDRESLLLKSARWLEPDVPARADDSRGPKMDSRVDFGNWLQLGGVMWPMEITRWLGGKVEFRVEVNDVKVNQPLADSLFQNPAR